MVGVPRPGDAGALWVDVRGFMDWARAAGYSGVQMDITMAGLRPRDLDASARRDIVSSLARRGLFLAGLDLFIPSSDLVDAARMDRAIGAIDAGLSLATDLRAANLDVGGAGVSVVLPEKLDAGTLAELASLGQRWGASLVDHAWKSAFAGSEAGAGVVVRGIDPAAIGASEGAGKVHEAIAAALTGISGARVASGSSRIGAARLSESGGVGRIEVGVDPGSRLDVLAYAAGLVGVGFGGGVA